MTSFDASAFLPLSRPPLDDDDIAAVVAVLRSGWITTGPKTAELEQRFTELTGCRHAVALASATAGMHLLLHALDIGPGDEVITPSLTWVSTLNMIAARGATPVFADVDRDTLMTDAGRIEPLIGPRTKMLVPVHFAGASLDLDPLRRLAKRHGVFLAEDCAHAHGTEYRGEPVGRQGTGIFSLHAIKNVTTAEGGMLCTDDEALARRVRRLRFHGLEADAFDRETHGRAPQAEVQEPGFKYNLPDMNAVLGLGQLRRLAQITERRTRLAGLYAEKLLEVEEIQPLGLPEYPHRHAWHLYVVRLDLERTGMDRDTFMQKLKEHGIGTGLHFRAAHLQKYYRETMPPGADRLPNTEWNSARICSLPLFPDMRDADVERVVGAIKSVLSEAKR